MQNSYNSQFAENEPVHQADPFDVKFQAFANGEIQLKRSRSKPTYSTDIAASCLYVHKSTEVSQGVFVGRKKDNSPLQNHKRFDAEKSTEKALKVGWGRLGRKRAFTYRAARKIQEAAILLDQVEDVDVYFVTLTHPGSTELSYTALEMWSGYVVNRFNQFLRQHLPEPYYVWVWEYQRRNAPHLHYALAIPSEYRHHFTEDNIKAIWFKILTDVSDRSGVDLFARACGGSWAESVDALKVSVQRRLWSVGSYMAKSYSKETRESLSGRDSAPGRWFGVSSLLQQLISQHRFTASFSVSSEEEAESVIAATMNYLKLNPEKVRPLQNPISGKRIGIIVWEHLSKLPLLKAKLRLIAKMFGWWP